MVNVIPPDYVDEVPVVEPNQHDDVLVVSEPIFVDEDKDPEDKKFEEEEDPQEEEDGMEIKIEEDVNVPKMTYPFEEMDPLNPLLHASEFEHDDKIEVENPIKHEDETVHVNIHEVAYALVEKKGKAKDKLYDDDMEIDIKENENELELTYSYEEVDPFNPLQLVYESEPDDEIVTAYELAEKKGKAKEKFYGQLIFELGNEIIMMNVIPPDHVEEVPIVEPNQHNDVPVVPKPVLVDEDEDSEEDKIMLLKSAPMTQAVIRQMIKDSVDAAITVERARQENARNDARAIIFQRWFEKTKSVFEISECGEGKKRFNELALMCPRMEEPERVKVDAYIWGLMDNINGEVTSSKPADLNEAVRMAFKLMEQNLQARDARFLE
nr:hypothetical protein [Tanacetum cinerariifolium]